MKTCIACQRSEAEVPFPLDKNMCKECYKTYKHNHYIKNKDKINQQNKNYYEENKTSILQYQKEYYYSDNGKLNSIYNTAKRRAKKLGIDFDLTKEWITEQITKQDNCCALTKIPFMIEQTKNYINPFAPSLDRINSNKGYTINNVRIVCVALNLSLNEFGEDVFTQVCQAYLKFKLQ